MKHLILTNDFKPMVGGVAQYLHGLAGAMHDKGHDVEVLAHGVVPSDEFCPPYDVTYHTSDIDRRLGDRFGDGLFIARKLNSLLHYRRVRADAVKALHAMVAPSELDSYRVYIGRWSHLAHWWCSWLRRRGLPYRIFAYGLELQRPTRYPWRQWRTRDLGAAEVVYTISEATGSLVKRECLDPDVRTAYPGVSRPKALAPIKRAASQLRQELRIQEHEVILVTVARLVKRKGVHKVLRCLGSGELQKTNVRYVVAGSGPECQKLERQRSELGLEGRVEFLGRVDETTKWGVYELGDVFVMPNDDLEGDDWEGFGIVFLEAAAMGLPAVAGGSGGAVEAVLDGVTGVVVDPESRKELQRALLRLSRDRNLRRTLGRRARRRVLRDFAWGTSAEEVLAAG